MRIARAFAIKAILIPGIAGMLLSGPVVAMSVLAAPATAAPAAAAVTPAPHMYHD
jgi:hypothetical protein